MTDKPKAPKLTPAQLELLTEAPTNCVQNYAPAKKLVELGLATHTLVGLSNGTLKRTAAGDAYLAERQKAAK